MDLFSTYGGCINLNLEDADVTYYSNFLPAKTAATLFREIYSNTNWRKDRITLFGKTYWQPRLTALYSSDSKPYSYSGIKMYPEPFPENLLQIKQQLELVCNTSYNTCLVNLYRDGMDSNGWHADNEKELGPNPSIASVSLGASRWFHLKHRTKKKQRTKIELPSGSLLLMKGTTQTYWLHQIAKTKRPVEPRINLTFRTVY